MIELGIKLGKSQKCVTVNETIICIYLFLYVENNDQCFVLADQMNDHTTGEKDQKTW